MNTDQKNLISSDLTKQEKNKIREEIRYARLIVNESFSVTEKPKSIGDKILGYLSNGFVLLILGALITSGLVPTFQRQHEARAQEITLMKKCLSQFLLYSNSIWQEYYTILPLTQEIEIDKKTYIKYINKIAQIKLKRYNSFAEIEALSIVFRGAVSNEQSNVENAIKSYAISLNSTSAAIDKWLSDLYCTPTVRENSPCELFDPTFDSFAEYLEIKKLVLKIGNKTSDEVASKIVKKITKVNK
jgi:hypothetical protein